MKAIAAVAIVLTLASPAWLESQQHAHGKPAEARPTQARDTLSGIVVAIDTMRAEGMMAGMKHDRSGMQHDSGGMTHDMTGMKHDMGGMTHAECHKMMTEGGGGLALRIQVGQDTLAAHLGPIWYLKQQHPDGFAVGDHLTIDGVAMKGEMPAHLMAYGVTKGGTTIVLRDATGKPRWASAMMKAMKGMKASR